MRLPQSSASPQKAPSVEPGAEKRKPPRRVLQNDNGKCNPHRERPRSHAVIGTVAVHSEHQSATSLATPSMRAKIDWPRRSVQIHHSIGIGMRHGTKTVCSHDILDTVDIATRRFRCGRCKHLNEAPQLSMASIKHAILLEHFSIPNPHNRSGRGPHHQLVCGYLRHLRLACPSE